MPTAKSTRLADQQLRESVAREIEFEPRITSKEINVAVHHRVVTLSGFAHGYMEKLAADEVAKRVYGVVDVLNTLAVQPGVVLPDQELTREAMQALQRNYTVPDTRIEITVQDGELVLEGSVEWHFQRDAAEAAVRDLAGVKAVSNRIVVIAGTPAGNTRAQIEEALRRRAGVDPRRIVVASHNGTVELSGSVCSWAEKDEAACIAWEARGVTQVENRIAVVP